MARTVLFVLLCVGLLPAAAEAANHPLAAVLEHYDRDEIAAGAIQVSAAGDVAYVSGTSEKGPWLDVWRRRQGEWTRVAGVDFSAAPAIRFGAKRSRSCRTS